MGPAGADGAPGKDGKDGLPGPRGPSGKPGKEGAQGDAGDDIKKELKVHLNSLKGYVDMKFDVLKSMMSKYGNKKAAKAAELGEGKQIAKKIAAAHSELTSTLDAFANA
jgi:hypothetical protein